MKIISHRGNLYGPDGKNENTGKQLKLAISLGFDVEADVWKIGNILWLGHDEPEYLLHDDLLEELAPHAWFHCKNFEALDYFATSHPNLNFFYHTDEDFVLSRSGHIWTYPGKELGSKSICVLPEITLQRFDIAYGICTDEPVMFKDLI